ncbi:Uncharacterised protein [uncultured archaeon]|nr:Uncharacterised protein [uncultured archaeon]
MYNYIFRAGVVALIALTLVSTGAEFNGTVYHLGSKEIEITKPINCSSLNLTLSYKTDNITLQDDLGRNVDINHSYVYWRGDYIYSLTFPHHVKGMLIYAMPSQGQQFILPLNEAGPVRIILPPGYTTGDRTLGIARPPPDLFWENDTGSILTWNNTTMVPYIEVSYYRSNAPVALMMIFAIMALAGIALLVEYYFSIRRLRSMSEHIEEISGEKLKRH